jgi:hypothetical protein
MRPRSCTQALATTAEPLMAAVNVLLLAAQALWLHFSPPMQFNRVLRANSAPAATVTAAAP